MLEQLFAGNIRMPLTEAPWSMAELKGAIARVKANKAADDALLHLFRTCCWLERCRKHGNEVHYSTCCRKQGEQNQHRTFVQLLWSDCCTVIQNICIFGPGWDGTTFFFSHAFFPAIRSLRAVLLGSFQALGLFLYWPVSRCAKSKGKVH